MSYYNDIKQFGERLLEIRTSTYEEKKQNDKFMCCRSQTTFGAELGLRLRDKTKNIKEIERRTIARWEHGDSYPRLDQFAAICDILNCDPAVLLSAKDPNKISVHDLSSSVRYISSNTGIAYDNVEEIIFSQRDRFPLSEKVNYLLSAPEFKDICHLVDLQLYDSYVNDDMCKHFSNNLLNLLINAYEDTRYNCSNYDEFLPLFSANIKEKIKFTLICNTEDHPNRFLNYWSKNLSEDRFNDIYKQAEDDLNIADDEIALYEHFISRLSEDSYPMLQSMEKREYNSMRLYNLFVSLIDRYIKHQKNTIKERINLSIDHIKCFDTKNNDKDK